MADGSPAIGYEDIKEHTDDVITREPMWLLFKTIEVIQGHSQPKASLAEQIARSSAPHLLISAGSRRRSGASSTTAAAVTAPSSGTCPRPATRPR